MAALRRHEPVDENRGLGPVAEQDEGRGIGPERFGRRIGKALGEHRRADGGDQAGERRRRHGGARRKARLESETGLPDGSLKLAKT